MIGLNAPFTHYTWDFWVGPGPGTGKNLPQAAHFEPFRAQAREQVKTGSRRLILSLFGPRPENRPKLFPRGSILGLILILILILFGLNTS